MSIDMPSSVDADVCDAFGELANMIGGNLKAVLPSKVEISMPSMVQGIDYSLWICGGNLACRLAFRAK